MPVRTCVSCGEKKEKTELHRISNKFTPDDGQTTPGRGAYVCKNVLCIEKLSGRNTIFRSLRKVPTKSDMESVIQQLKVIDERDDS
jgi:predicted RNA-binding protein YlxR (DUF448 family)